MKTVEFREGAIVARQGDAALTAFILLYGEMVRRRRRHSLRRDRAHGCHIRHKPPRVFRRTRLGRCRLHRRTANRSDCAKVLMRENGEVLYVMKVCTPNQQDAPTAAGDRKRSALCGERSHLLPAVLSGCCLVWL